MAMAEMKVKFSGKWKCYRSENFEDLAKEIGMNFLMRKVASNASPEEEIIIDGDWIIMRMKMGPISKESKFKLNEEFKDERMGTQMTCFARFEDGILKMRSIPINKPDMKEQNATRDIINDELVVHIVVGEVSCKRYFKRVPHK